MRHQHNVLGGQQADLVIADHPTVFDTVRQRPGAVDLAGFRDGFNGKINGRITDGMQGQRLAGTGGIIHRLSHSLGITLHIPGVVLTVGVAFGHGRGGPEQ